MAFLPGLRVGLTLDTATFVSETRRVGAAVDRMGGNVARQNALAEQSFGKLNTAVRVVKGALVGLGVGLGLTGVVQLTKQIISTADEYNKLTGRLRVALGEHENIAKVQQQLFKTAQSTRADLQATTELFARFAQSSGESTQRLLDLTETINQTISVSGASTTEAVNSLRQFSQGIASGVLRGEELNSIMENLPRLAQAIAEGMGVTVGKLRELGKEGELTTEVILAAIEKQAPKIAAEFEKVPLTVDAAMTKVRNSFTLFSADMDKSVGSSRVLAESLSELADVLAEAKVGQFLQEFLAAGARAFADLIRLIKATSAGVQAAIAAFVRFKDQSLAAIKALVDGIGRWLGAPFKAAFDSVTGTLDATRAKFQEWYQAIVGGSIVPDTVREIQGWMERLKGPAMVDPATEAVDRTVAEFARLRAINDEEMRRRVGQATATAGVTAPAEAATVAGGGTLGEALLENVREFVRSAQSTLADFFEEVFSGGVTSFKDLFDEALRLAQRFAAEVAAMLVFRPVLQSSFLTGAAGAGAAAIIPASAPTFGAPIVSTPGGVPIHGIGAAPGLLGSTGFLGSNITGGQALMAAGLGAAGGSLIGGFFGGQGQIGGGIGGAGGAAAGALIGSVVPGVGTLLGGIAGGLGGSLLGGALGGLFGGGDSENRVTIGRGLGGLGGTSAAARFVEEVDKGIVAALTESQRKMVDRLIKPVTVEYEKQLDEASKRAIASARFGPAAQALGFRVAGITGGGASAEEMQRRFFEAIQTQEQIADLTSGLGDFGRQARALTEQFDDLRERAEQYGISLKGVSAAQREAGRDLIRARLQQLTGVAPSLGQQLAALNDEFSDLRQGARLLGLETDNIKEAGARARTALKEQFAAQREAERAQRTASIQAIQARAQQLTGIGPTFREQLEAVNDQFAEMRQQMRALGAGLQGVSSAGKQAIATLKAQQQAQQDALALSVVEPFRELADPLRGFQDELRISMLNPAQQVADAAETFRRMADEAAGGSITALQGIVGAGQRFIEQQGRFGASPAIAAATAEVQSVIGRLLEQIERAQAQAERGLEDAIRRASQREIDTMKEIIAEARNIVAEIRRISR